MLTTNFEESQDNFELIKEDEALLGFITDYLSKRGFNDTVKSLYKENNSIKLIPKDKVNNLIESVNQIRGNLHKNESVLFEWWKVFWNILKENKQKQSSGTGTGSGSEGRNNCNLVESAAVNNNYSNSINVNTNTDGKKRSFRESNVKSMKIIIEEVSSGRSSSSTSGTSNSSSSNSSSTSNTSSSSSTSSTSISSNSGSTSGSNSSSTSNSGSTSTSSNNNNTGISTEHPYKKLKKKPVVPFNTMNTLDISSLTGIEKSLLSANLMNRDLTKLTSEEGKRIETALINNKVSKESWELYLRLCKEYQKMPQVLKNPKINYSTPPNPDFIINDGNNSNYLGVIDQVNQPIDSRQLLLLRQSLYQEYLKKQSNTFNYARYPIYSIGANASAIVNSATTIVNSTTAIVTADTNSTSSTTNTANTIASSVLDPANISHGIITTNTPATPIVYYFDENIFGAFDGKEELNFNDFMNDYLI